MRPAVFVLLCILLACQEPATRVVPVTVEWMDWPAEVNAGQPFRTRLVVSGVCGLDPRFHVGASADLSAVTFSPYFVVDDRPVACLDVQTITVALVAIGIDTAGMAPGLAASTSRDYAMLGATWAYTLAARAFAIGQPQPLPVRLFGNVTVRLGGADSTRRNAAGEAYLVHDSTGCARVRPIATYRPDTYLPLEDQADTTSLQGVFVSGYIYNAAAPVCGETRVFHLVSRN
jgi:hypothetical protein